MKRETKGKRRKKKRAQTKGGKICTSPSPHSAPKKCGVYIGERLIGNTIGGKRTESLREQNLPPRGSPKRPALCDLIFITSVPLGGFRRPSRRKIFLLETLGPVAPNRVAPQSVSKKYSSSLECSSVGGEATASPKSKTCNATALMLPVALLSALLGLSSAHS